MSDYRAEVGEVLNAQTQTETSREFEMADLVAQQLSGESYRPVADGMTAEREIQAAMDTEHKQTQTPLLREEEELKRMADENRQMELALREGNATAEDAGDLQQAGGEAEISREDDSEAT